MAGCLFCRIVKREIPGKMVYEDENCLAFEDINPQAPVHILIVPKKHIDSLVQVQDSDAYLLGHLLLTANRLAKDRGIAKTGYRTVINTGAAGGQTVFHLHVHLLAGRSMHWPPG